MHARKYLCFARVRVDFEVCFNPGKEIGELFHGTTWIK